MHGKGQQDFIDPLSSAKDVCHVTLAACLLSLWAV
jgi:hypothetical protein